MNFDGINDTCEVADGSSVASQAVGDVSGVGEDADSGCGNQSVVAKTLPVETAGDGEQVAGGDCGSPTNAGPMENVGRVYTEGVSMNDKVNIGPGGTMTSVLPEACPRIEVKLFIGRVPREYDEEDLKPVFSPFGTVLECLIIKDKVSNISKGSGFIRMKSLRDADNAIFELHNKRILSKELGPVQVRYATGEPERLGMSEVTANPGGHEAKLFVGSLPRNVTEQEVRDVFTPFGNINEVYLLRCNTTGQGKGSAFVKFDIKECALWAISKLNGDYTFPGFGRPLEVRFAESKKALVQGVVNMAPNQMVQPMNPMGYQYHGGYQAPQPQMVYTSPVYSNPGTAPGASTQNTVVGASTQSNNTNPRRAGCWTEYFTPEGRPYYHNETTNSTTWEMPREFEQVPPPVVRHPAPVASATPAGPGLQVGPGMAPGAAMTGGQMGDVAGPPGANVFIFHVPNEWTANELLQCFGPWGTIVSARVAVDKLTQRNKGYAFVSYDNIQSAVNAVQNMNGYMAGTKRLKVSIKQGEEQYVQGVICQNGGGAPPPGSAGQGGGRPYQPIM